MTTPDLSPAVTAYFELMREPSKAGVAALFTADASVTDDGRTFTGDGEIRAWLAGPASEYTVTHTLVGVERSARNTIADVLLEGDFPGGRVLLRHRFREAASGLITRLTIAVE